MLKIKYVIFQWNKILNNIFHNNMDHNLLNNIF